MATRTDGTEVFQEGESFKTGSQRKAERLAAYVDWLLTPPDERTLKTKTEFARYWGVTLETLRKDTQEPFVQRELASRARAVARVDRLPAVLDNLYRLATGGGPDPGGGAVGAATPPAAQVAAARTLLDWMERTANIREQDVNVRDLSNTELMELALRLLNEASDQE